MNTTPKHSVIIPAYNEESSIRTLLESMVRMNICQEHEVIVIDDGSTDETAKISRLFPVRVITHETNKGYGASLKTGIRKANGDKVLTLDSDGQHDPAFIEKAFKMLEEYDMVIGERGVDSYHVKNRKGGKKFIRKVGEYLVDQKLPDFNSGFRGFDRKLILSMLHLMPNGFSFSTTSTLAFLKEGYSIGTFPIIVSERQGRASNVRFIKDGIKTLLLLFRIIMLFNPLKVFFPSCVIITIIGFLWGIHGFFVFADQIAILNRKKA